MTTPNASIASGAGPQDTEAPLPRVSVVFLAYNRRDALRESLQRMRVDSGYPAERLELIVVDNASSDDTAAMVEREHPSATLVRNERNVGAPGWNEGFRIANGDYVLVGAMYSAPADYTPDQLDALIPLSVAHWHAHTNICLPDGVTLDDILRGDVGSSRIDEPGMLPVSSSQYAPAINQRLGFLADGRFGFTGKIADASSCEAAGGQLLKQAFGWMVHVYPFNGDDLKVAFGMSVPKPPAN